MSKGLTCDICKKTTTVGDFDRAVLPEGFDGWLHLGVSKRVVDRAKYADIPFDQLKYHEIDICPECAEKIDMVQRNSMPSSSTKCMFDLVGRIMVG